MLASNTSGLPIQVLGAAAGRPAQVVGLHFFNPVPAMSLVEVIRAPETADDTVARALEFCAAHLGDLDQRVLDWAAGPEFDRLIVDTVTATYPEHEHERFIAHFRGLTGLWVTDETARLSSSA